MAQVGDWGVYVPPGRAGIERPAVVVAELGGGYIQVHVAVLPEDDGWMDPGERHEDQPLGPTGYPAQRLWVTRTAMVVAWANRHEDPNLPEGDLFGVWAVET
jgi:hypothetical protein